MQCDRVKFASDAILTLHFWKRNASKMDFLIHNCFAIFFKRTVFSKRRYELSENVFFYVPARNMAAESTKFTWQRVSAMFYRPRANIMFGQKGVWLGVSREIDFGPHTRTKTRVITIIIRVVRTPWKGEKRESWRNLILPEDTDEIPSTRSYYLTHKTIRSRP